MISTAELKQIKSTYPVRSVIRIDGCPQRTNIPVGIMLCIQLITEDGTLHCTTSDSRYVAITPDFKYSLVSSSSKMAGNILPLKSGYFYEFTFSGGYTRHGIVIEYVPVEDLGIYMHMRASMATNTPGYAVIDTYGDLHIINPMSAKMRKTDENIKMLLRKTVKLYKEWGTLYREYLNVLTSIKYGIRSSGLHPPEYYAAEDYRIQQELNALKEAWDNCPHAGR